uniref:Lipoprotein n=1 Tax=Strongyloides venezuelensis TaxID=75913 RepID=A0A0K0FEY8_STRVS
MKKILKVLWILAVYSIYICSCHGSDDYIKQFKYYSENDIYQDSLPRNQSVISNTEIIAIKCPNDHIVSRFKLGTDIISYTAVYKRPDDSVKESLSFKSRYGNRHHWRIYNIQKTESVKIINCLNIYKDNETNPIEKWNHLIKRTKKQKLNITREKDLNIMLHSHTKKIYNSSVSEKTIVFGARSGYREFNSEHPQVYKGDKLVTFNATEINSEDIEFLEPIDIIQPYHPPPIFKIDNNKYKGIISKNKKLWIAKPRGFPWTFNISLEFNGFTNQPHFFKYEDITLSYLDLSKKNRSEGFEEDIEKVIRFNERVITLKEPTIISLIYICDNCVNGGITVMQHMTIGIDVDFGNKILPTVKYSYDQLNFKPNCSFNTNVYSHLKGIVFNKDKTTVIRLVHQKDKNIERFKLEEGLVVVTDKNPSGTLVCIYDVFNEKVAISQKFETF